MMKKTVKKRRGLKTGKFRNTKKLTIFAGVMLAVVLLVSAALIQKNIASAEAVPRLIITGYDVTSGEIKAGCQFEITLHLKNESTKTALSNILLKVSSEGNEFVTTSGSSSIYIEKIGSEETMDVSISLKARNDLEQKPYLLNVTGEYEDRYNMVYTMNENLSLSVIQTSKFILTETSISPDNIYVGEKTNITFAISNVGKATLYNVNVKIEGDTITGTDAYIGNILPGESSYFDSMVKAVKESGNEGSVNAVITYEDVDGNVKSATESLELTVEKEVPEKSDEEKKTVVVQKPPVPVPLVATAAVIVIIIIVIAVLIKRGKKRRDEMID
ncbi:MAG: hypothetical protein J6L77_02080 [Coprococcus sp.]|nr:hypothetical protein [Coprococcus sp.]